MESRDEEIAMPSSPRPHFVEVQIPRPIGAALLSWAVAAVAVEAPATVDAPVFAPGDCWTYANSQTPDTAGTSHRAREWVRRVTPGGEVEMTHGPRDPVVHIRLDRNGNYIRRYEWSFDPSESDLRFPLAVGATWNATHSVRKSDSSLPSHTDADYKVVGYGPVHVAAGDFDAFEVRAVGSVRFEDNPFHGAAVTTTWYAPAVRRFVKRDAEYRDSRTRIAWHQELVSFGHLELAGASPLKEPVSSEAEAASGAAAGAASGATPASASASTSASAPRFIGHC